MLKNVIEYLQSTAAKQGGKVALVEGEKRLTFGELLTAAGRLGGLVHRQTQAVKRPVAVYLPKSLDAVVSFMGIVYSGNCYAPLDVKSPLPRTAKIVANLKPALIITAPEYVEAVQSLQVAAEQIVLIDCAYDAALPYEPDVLAAVQAQLIDTDPVYIIHTSGSTGTPKGVVIAHRGVIDYIDWAVDCFAVDETAVIGNQSPFYFDNSTLDIYLCMAAGATLVIIPEQYFSFPVRLMEYLQERQVNFIFWVPSVMINIANLQLLDNLAGCPLQKILFAGEVMPNRHLNYWRRRLPDALYANLYGPTEITVDCTYYVVDRRFEDHEPLPIGVPCRNSDVLIIDSDNRQVLQPEQLGELCVRGSSLALGYWNDPEKTASAFTQNPLHQHYPEVIYRTGDLVQYNERHEIIYVGRKDSQIKHMGYRIELGEIETAVLSLPDIGNACVLYNHDKREIVLLFEGKRGSAMDAHAIRKALAPLLPKYMLPTVICQLEKLPFNPNGKIDRVALAAAYLKG